MKARQAMMAGVIAASAAIGFPGAAAAADERPGVTPHGAAPPVHIAHRGPQGERRGMRERHGDDAFGEPRHRRDGPAAMLRGLDLTEAQRDEVFRLLHGRAPEMREQAKRMRTAHRELRELAVSGSFDRARATELAEAGARAQAQIALLRAETASQLLAVLTPEQRATFDERRKRRAGRDG